MLEPYLKKTRDATSGQQRKPACVWLGRQSISFKPGWNFAGPADRAGVRISDIHRDFLTFHQFSKKVISLKNLPKSRPKNGSDAEISINLARCRGPYLGWPRSLLGPYLARANSRAQCRGQRLSARLEILQTLPNLERRAQSTHMFAVL